MGGASVEFAAIWAGNPADRGRWSSKPVAGVVEVSKWGLTSLSLGSESFTGNGPIR